MACGGFHCSKNALAALNILYILVAFILIGIAGYGKAIAVITSISLLGGIIACGVFLLFIAIVGLIGALKHHQVLLFFYMIILFLIFLVQFAVACACLAMNQSQQKSLAESSWKYASDELKMKTQVTIGCCGFEGDHTSNDTSGLNCGQLECCKKSPMTSPCCTGDYPVNGTTASNDTTGATCPCHDCWSQMSEDINTVLKLAGGIGLFFSFTEMIGVWLALRYRNQKDPRANPSAFL